MRSRSGRGLSHVGPRSFVAALALALCAPSTPGAQSAAQAGRDAGAGFVQLDLPPSGAVKIENRRGGVFIETWGEKFLAVAARGEGAAGAGDSSPVRFERTDSLLTISVPLATTNTDTRAPRRVVTRGTPRAATPRLTGPHGAAAYIDLIVRVPAQARVEVLTSAGAVEANRLPARFDAQTVSGDLRIALPRDSDVMARTLYGTIKIGAGLASGATSTRERFSARFGLGGKLVRLSTVRGSIALTALAEAPDFASGASSAPRTAVARDPSVSERAASASAPTPPGLRADSSAGDVNATNQRERAAESSLDTAAVAGKSVRPPALVGAQEGSTRPATAPQPRVPSPAAPIEVDEDEVLTVDTNLVTLNFSVVDRRSGRGLTGLTGGDFRVSEDGVEQQITHFESANAPFDLLLLLDLSGSTARVTDLIRASALRFIDAVRAGDRVGVVAFAAEPRVLSPLTSDKALLRSRLSSLGAPQGDTKLYDALDYSLNYLAANSPKQRRRAVVVLTDGLDSSLPNVQGEGSALAYKELRRRVQEFDGLFYAVMTDNYEEPQSPLDVQPETYDLAYDRMEELANTAGGLYYEAEKLEDVADIYARVVEDLGTVYSISYLPTDKTRDGRWRTIRVRLPRHPTAIARGKSGYYAK